MSSKTSLAVDSIMWKNNIECKLFDTFQLHCLNLNFLLKGVRYANVRYTLLA